MACSWGPKSVTREESGLVSEQGFELLPRIRVRPPGPRSRARAERLRRAEAPGINTLFGDRPSLVWERAEGSLVWDLDGNRFLDFTSGFGAAAIGHRHPDVVEASRRQGEALLHGLGDVHAHEPRLELAERLRELAPVDDGVVYFAISGSDAVEIALKTARLSTGKSGLLAFEPAYHGLTLGALAATSRTEFREPFVGAADRASRLAFGAPEDELEEALAQNDVGCVIVEPIVGREGVLLPPAGWLATLADLCRRRNVVFVVDEILTGFGRTGRVFAVDHEDLRPDLLCCGKALGGGLPIAAVVGCRDLMEAWRSPGEARHTATFVAHPVACRAALAVLEVLRRERLAERASRLEGLLASRLRPLARTSGVREVRGRGLLWGIELDSPELAADISQTCLERGLILLAGGCRGDVLELLPALTIERRQLEFALDLLVSAVEERAGRDPGDSLFERP